MAEPEEIMRAGYIVELGFAQSALEPFGYTAEVVDPDDHSLVPELVVQLGTDDQDRHRSLRLSFVPDASELDHTKLLLIFGPLPFDVPDDRVGDVRQAITIVNDSLALGEFGMQDTGGLYYRYVLATPRSTFIDDDMLAEVVRFADFHQEHFGDYIEGVCAGEVELSVLAEVIRQAD